MLTDRAIFLPMGRGDARVRSCLASNIRNMIVGLGILSNPAFLFRTFMHIRMRIFSIVFLSFRLARNLSPEGFPTRVARGNDSQLKIEFG